MASIIVVSGRHEGDFYQLGQKTIVIGRDESLPIQIVDDRISRRHMQIHFNQNSWSYSVADMNSKNGVLINNVKNDKETRLTDGDYITIGDTTLMFTVKDFFDRESAQAHARKFGQKDRPTQIDGDLTDMDKILD